LILKPPLSFPAPFSRAPLSIHELLDPPLILKLAALLRDLAERKGEIDGAPYELDTRRLGDVVGVEVVAGTGRTEMVLEDTTGLMPEVGAASELLAVTVTVTVASF
jgi:hypothetical protein